MTEMTVSIIKRIGRNVAKEVYAVSYPMRRRLRPLGRIVACVFSVGERTEGEAVESVQLQSFPVERIELIKNVTPISAALNRVFDVAYDADHVLLVDADMILHRNCLESLARFARKNVLYSVGELIDPILGKIGHVKLLNLSLARSSGLRFRDVLGSDFDLIKQSEEKGLDIIPMSGSSAKKAFGIHHPAYTAKELFRKMQIWRKKRGNQVDSELLLLLSTKYRESGNKVLLYGMLGLITDNPDESLSESYPDSGLNNWERAIQLLGPIDDEEVYGFPEFVSKKEAYV